MNHKQIKEFEDDLFFDWDYYYDHHSDQDYYRYLDECVNYDRLDNGLVDWSDEIPQSVKRQHKIDQILNDNPEEDNSYNLGKFWPK